MTQKTLMKYIQKLVNLFGYEINKRSKLEIGFTSNYLSRICKPKLVFDVGVGHGTFSLYEAYPDAHFVLIEPLSVFESSINKIMSKFDCEIHYKSVKEFQALSNIYVDSLAPTRSSHNVRTKLSTTGNPIVKRSIKTTTLDKIYENCLFKEGPIIIKIDTEGSELSALKGAKNLLKLTDYIIAEVNVAERFESGYKFEDFILFMLDNNFYLYSILNIVNNACELRPRYIDVLFKRNKN